MKKSIDRIEEKAGAVIWYNSETGPLVLLRKSSNINYGGPEWQLGKGGRETYKFVIGFDGERDPSKVLFHHQESAEKTAIRECVEECGLIRKNIKQIESLFIERRPPVPGVEKHHFYHEVIHWFAIQLQEQKLKKFGFETSEVAWFDLEEAAKLIRRRQRKVLVALRKKYSI